MFYDLMQGFAFVFLPFSLLMLVFGTFFGIVIGAIPGLSGSMGIILLLPLVHRLPSDVGLVMLAGLFCGSMMGGSISAILLNTPGTPSAAATALDGYPLAKKGQAGKAIGMAAISSGMGGLISVICLVFIAPQLSRVALQFHGADYFSLAVFGLAMIGATSGKYVLKGLISGVAGMLIATVGVDSVMGTARFTFGQVNLMSGLPLLSVLIGVFAISEIIEVLSKKTEALNLTEQNVKNVLPTWAEIKSTFKVSGISGLIGVFIGIVPGTGGSISAFLSYNVAQKISKTPEGFGQGSLEGIAAAESSNNGTTGGALIPMLTLGVPGDVVTAVMLGAMVLIGVRPGPLIFTEAPDVVYGLFAGMFVIQFVMVAIGLGFARISPYILKIPQKLLMPIIMVLCIVGAFSLANQIYHAFVALAFGIIGYFMKKYHYPAAPMVLGVILGPLAEVNLNRALMVTRGDWSILVTRPISLTFLILSVGFVVMTAHSNMKKAKKEKTQEKSTEEIEIGKEEIQ